MALPHTEKKPVVWFPMTKKRKDPPTAESQDEQSALAKGRRTAVKWDHRRDKYLLLAIFSQLNTPTPDWNQLSEMMGSDTYSPAMLQHDLPLLKRFLVLQEMSAAVMEDRQDRNAELYPYEAGAENDDVVYVAETTSRTAASISHKLPPRPPSQPSDHPRVQFSLPKSKPSSFSSQRGSHNRSGSDEYSPPPPSNRKNSNHGSKDRHGHGAKVANSPPRKALRSDEWPDKSLSPRPVQRWPEERQVGMAWGSEVCGKRRHSSDIYDGEQHKHYSSREDTRIYYRDDPRY
ncbi:hypothetical protein BJY00DRAFT_281511 [Aspergillus carlsbadensis]|nr:hypothetical protein BJY00DRAFT_281511 [Aspergillus carlsbadensis]